MKINLQYSHIYSAWVYALSMVGEDGLLEPIIYIPVGDEEMEGLYA